MRLPGRLAAAIAVLAEVEGRRRPVSEALKDWGNSNRFAGAGDRAAIGNLVYDALRRRGSHAWSMQSDAPRALVLSVAVRDWGEPADALAAALADDRFGPGAITEAELGRLLLEDPLADAPDHVRADLPEWVVPQLEASLGPDWVAEGQALAGRPPLDLRVNTLKSSRERVLKSLSRFSPQAVHISPVGVRLAAGTHDARTPNVQTDEGFLKGWFEVQDQGSQIAALLTGAQPGEQMLDLCAGAGGKTLALAAMMQNRGQIFAHDSDRTRLAPIYDRLKRNGARNVQVRPPGSNALADLRGRMDRVVVDAPCTGAGTWRRRPEAKWKLTPEQLAARVLEQLALLADAAAFVRPGGVLVYITCSVLAAENDAQASAFLTAHPDFRLLDLAELWSDQFPGVAFPERAQGALGVALSPHSTETDGFYVAAFSRLVAS